MGLKKSYNRFSKKPNKVRRIQYEYALDLWRVRKLSIGFIARDHKDHQVAVTLFNLINDSRFNKEITINKTIINLENKKLYLIQGDKKITFRTIEKKVTSKKRKHPSQKYQLWVVSQYLA